MQVVEVKRQVESWKEKVDHLIFLNRQTGILKVKGQEIKNEMIKGQEPGNQQIVPFQKNLSPSTQDQTIGTQINNQNNQVSVYRFLNSDPKDCISEYARQFKIVKLIRRKMHRLGIQASILNQNGIYQLNEQLYKTVGGANKSKFMIRIDLRSQDGNQDNPEDLNGMQFQNLLSLENRSLFSKMQSTMSINDQLQNEAEQEDFDDSYSEDDYIDSDIVDSKSHLTSQPLRSRGQSLHNDTFSNERQSKKLLKKQRKDPLHVANRFKFTQAEDKILHDYVLPKLNQDQTKLFNEIITLDEWKTLQDKYFDQRPIFELVRRCIELINEKEQQNAVKEIKKTRRRRGTTFSQIEDEIKSESEEEEKQSVCIPKQRGKDKVYNTLMPWTQEENDLLVELVDRQGYKSWREISNFLPTRSPLQCRYHYVKINPRLKKVKIWDEPLMDVKLLIGVKLFGDGKWSEITEHLFNKELKDLQCAERYSNILDQKIINKPWNKEEDDFLMEMVEKYQNQWAKISQMMGGTRTDNQCKRRAKAITKKRIKNGLKQVQKPPVQVKIKKHIQKKPKQVKSKNKKEASKTKAPLKQQKLKFKQKDQIEEIKPTIKIEKAKEEEKKEQKQPKKRISKKEEKAKEQVFQTNFALGKIKLEK